MSTPIGIATRVAEEEAHDVSPSPAPRYVPRGVLAGNRSPPLLSVRPPREDLSGPGFLLDDGSDAAALPPSQQQQQQVTTAATAAAEEGGKGVNVEALSALWQLTKKYLPRSTECVMQQIATHIEFSLARSQWNMDAYALYQATALSLRDRLIEYWNDTQEHFSDNRVKRMYYMSIEYLMGRYLHNAVVNTGLQQQYSEALRRIGAGLEDIYDEEQDAALGSGGLGRLAACFLDSLATLDYPAWGYGLRYEFGMFKQNIVNGQQAEVPEYWLERGNAWEICRRDNTYRVNFGGSVTAVRDPTGSIKHKWEGATAVMATAYDTPVPGFGTHNTLNLRLWSATPATVFDLEQFNREDQHPDYWSTLNQRQRDENITKVLYPKMSPKGQELRLKQQYFFSCATLQDILRRFKRLESPLRDLSSFAAIQLNDTHPAIAVAELMRILVDIEGLPWADAWDITIHTFSYTNHTILPEALESWPVPLFQYLLPRHLQIIFDINQHFIDRLRSMQDAQGAPAWSDEQVSRMSIIEEGTPKRIRMANLAIIGSHKVNGVAQIHSDILKNQVFRDFFTLWPDKFLNITNGVTPRRWLLMCNPALSGVISSSLGGNSWVVNLDSLSKLSGMISPDLIRRVQEAKLANKQRMRRKILKLFDGKIEVDPTALFDVHVKRIHEYKRQLLNILGVIHRYLTLKKLSPEHQASVVSKVVIFAGKAAAGYDIAKLVIKLINSVAEVINNDKTIHDKLKVVFLPNYSVSLAEVIIPASDLSQHISTAGTEASGTSNMKFVMNGGLIIGTLDGANIEIMEHVGRENMFVFGATKPEVDQIRTSAPCCIDERLYDVLRAIADGRFGQGEQFFPLIEPLWHGNDYYAVAHDFPLYLEELKHVDAVWKSPEEWTRRCIHCVAGTGFFSSDRTIHEYARNVWGLKPSKLPGKAEKTKQQQPSKPAGRATSALAMHL